MPSSVFLWIFSWVQTIKWQNISRHFFSSKIKINRCMHLNISSEREREREECSWTYRYMYTISSYHPREKITRNTET